jgi:hypothetical protein
VSPTARWPDQALDLGSSAHLRARHRAQSPRPWVPLSTAARRRKRRPRGGKRRSESCVRHAPGGAVEPGFEAGEETTRALAIRWRLDARCEVARRPAGINSSESTAAQCRPLIVGMTDDVLSAMRDQYRCPAVLSDGRRCQPQTGHDGAHAHVWRDRPQDLAAGPSLAADAARWVGR